MIPDTKLKNPNGTWAKLRQQIDEDVLGWAQRQAPHWVALKQLYSVMASLHGYKRNRVQRSVYRLARKRRGPRLVRKSVGLYAAEG